MITIEIDEAGRNGFILLQPNRSASWNANLYLIGFLSLACLIVASYMAYIGAWLVFPFAGLEILLLSVATFLWFRENTRREVIRFSDAQVVVEKGRYRPVSGWRIQRAWARVELQPSGHPWYPDRVVIGAMDKEIEVGGFLNPEDRDLLVTTLARLIRLQRS